jgi:hypothetical protein
MESIIFEFEPANHNNCSSKVNEVVLKVKYRNTTDIIINASNIHFV